MWFCFGQVRFRTGGTNEVQSSSPPTGGTSDPIVTHTQSHGETNMGRRRVTSSPWRRLIQHHCLALMLFFSLTLRVLVCPPVHPVRLPLNSVEVVSPHLGLYYLVFCARIRAKHKKPFFQTIQQHLKLEIYSCMNSTLKCCLPDDGSAQYMFHSILKYIRSVCYSITQKVLSLHIEY